MTRKTSLWAFVLVLVVSVVGFAQDFSEFYMQCQSCAGADDSGTASGDGAGTVAPSNGSKGFQGPIPSYSSLELHNAKDLRFIVRVPFVPPTNFCSPVEECLYDAVLINRIRFFVSAIRTPLGDPEMAALYCSSNTCQTYNEVRIGERLGGIFDSDGDLRAVIYSTELLSGGGIQVDVGDTATLQLSKAQWQELNRVVGAVRAVDSSSNVEFFLGLGASVTAVDSEPDPLLPVKFVPESRHTFIGIVSNK
jgi:hypothetical protein